MLPGDRILLSGHNNYKDRIEGEQTAWDGLRETLRLPQDIWGCRLEELVPIPWALGTVGTMPRLGAAQLEQGQQLLLGPALCCWATGDPRGPGTTMRGTRGSGGSGWLRAEPNLPMLQTRGAKGRALGVPLQQPPPARHNLGGSTPPPLCRATLSHAQITGGHGAGEGDSAAFPA